MLIIECLRDYKVVRRYGAFTMHQALAKAEQVRQRFDKVLIYSMEEKDYIVTM